MLQYEGIAIKNKLQLRRLHLHRGRREWVGWLRDDANMSALLISFLDVRAWTTAAE